MLYIDILNSVNDLPRKRFRVKKGPVKRIRSSQYQVIPTEISRIVIDLEKWVKHKIAREENKLYLEFYKPEVLIAKAPPEEKVPPEEEEKVPPEEEEKAPPPGERLISLSFTDAPMSAVLNFLAEMSGYNIVASAEVIEGTVTINLKDVPVMTALDTILKTKDLWYTKEKNIITVMTMAGFLESVKAREELTKVYSLQYADAVDLAKVLNEVLGGAVKKELPKGKYWIETGAEETIAAMKTVTFKGKTFVIPEKRTNSLIITTDTPANFIMLESLIKKLDTATLQVLIETQIVEVKLSDEFKFGISWVLKDLNLPGRLEGVTRWDDLTDVADEPASALDTDLYWKEAGLWKFIVYNRHIMFLIQALDKITDLDIVSNPKLVTANHTKGHIFIGEKIPIVYGTGAGKWTWKWEEVGVTLDVTPHINEQGETTLEVKTHVSELGEYRTVFDVPSVITRTIETKTMVPNGQTLVIGGMMRNKISEGRDGIPGLMRIPGLRYLFSRKIKTKEKVEYLFFLTPRIVMAGREIRPEEVPEMREAVSAPLEFSSTPEVIGIEPKEKKKSNKKNKRK